SPARCQTPRCATSSCEWPPASLACTTWSTRSRSAPPPELRDRVVAVAIAGGLVVGAAGAAAVAFTGGGGGPSLPRLPVAAPAVSHAPAGRVPTPPLR